jgi:hypothetical protein
MPLQMILVCFPLQSIEFYDHNNLRLQRHAIEQEGPQAVRTLVVVMNHVHEPFLLPHVIQ